MAVVASPAYLADAPALATPRDLVHHRCIGYRMTGSGALYAWEFERHSEPFEVRVSGPLAFNEPALMLEAVLDGYGVGYLLDHEAAPHVTAGRLTRLFADWTPPFPGFHLYHSSRRHMRPILAAFIEAVRSAKPASQTSCYPTPGGRERLSIVPAPPLSRRRCAGSPRGRRPTTPHR